MIWPPRLNKGRSGLNWANKKVQKQERPNIKSGFAGKNYDLSVTWGM